MSGAGDAGLLDVGGHVAHDDRLQRTERLLSAHGQYRHGQLYLRKDFVVRRILGEPRELGESGPHSSPPRIRGGKEISGRLIRLRAGSAQVIPYAAQSDALAA